MLLFLDDTKVYRIILVDNDDTLDNVDNKVKCKVMRVAHSGNCECN